MKPMMNDVDMAALNGWVDLLLKANRLTTDQALKCSRIISQHSFGFSYAMVNTMLDDSNRK